MTPTTDGRRDRPGLPSAAVTLTAAAGVLHVAAALAHRQVSLVLTVAFVAVAVVQLGVVATARRWPEASAEVLLFTHLAGVGAWVVSRTIGLPLVGTGVEPVGAADLVTVVVELAAVAVVVAGPRLARLSARLTSVALVASLAAVAVATPRPGHAHDDDHAGAVDGVAPAAAGPVVQLGPGDFEGDTDLGRPANAERMAALMTGALQPVVITSDGRLLGASAPDTHALELAPAHDDAAPVDDDTSSHAHGAGTAPHGH